MFGLDCSLTKRIHRSIIATLALFLLGGIVLGSSFWFFDSRLKNPDIPQSLIDEKPKKCDGTIWKIFLIFSAGIGLPLGAYILATLDECKKQQDYNRSG